MRLFSAVGRACRRVLVGIVAVATVTGDPVAVREGDRAVAQDAAASAAEDDPFADELNPFGTGKAKPPAPSAPPAAAPRGGQEPRQDRVVEPAPAPRARPRPKLPVPFPEAPADDEAATRRERTRGRIERQPDGPSARPGRSADDAWLDRTEAEKMLAEAEKLERAGKLEDARDVLRKAVEKEPTLVVGHLALGVVLRRLGDFRGSVDACTQGIKLDPQEPEFYLRRGIAWFHQGLYGIALEDFEEAAGIAYEDPRPELWRGLTLVELDRPLEAINAYASAIRRDRTCMLAYLNRGLTYLATDEPGKAEFDFNQAIRHQPKDARVWFNRGVAQARQGRFAEAIVSYETALAIAPGDDASRRNLEAARRMAGRTAASPGR